MPTTQKKPQAFTNELTAADTQYYRGQKQSLRDQFKQVERENTDSIASAWSDYRSRLGDLGTQKNTATLDLRSQLGARGMSDPMFLGKGLGEINQQWGSGQRNLELERMNRLTALRHTLAQARQTRDAGVRNLNNEAAVRQASNSRIFREMENL